ncbi:MAG: GH3 family domain-containing protein, partial [Opitutaceae bacterium]
YEQLVPAIDQMKRGESDVLWPGRCTLFGRTAGTSNGQPRCLPMTESLLAHFREAGFASLLYYSVRTRHPGAFHGRHLYLGGATTLTSLGEGGGHPTFAGEASGIAALNFPKWVERHFYEPGPGIAQIPAWDAQVNAIAARTRSCDISLLAGVPDTVRQVSHVLRKKFSNGKKPPPPLQEYWPNLECYAHTGASLSPYAVELRRGLGPKVVFHETYAASEAIIAAQDAEPGQGLRLMSDQGVYFEFVALGDFDDLRLDQLGPKTVPTAGVKPGVDYVVLITTPGGLARYVLGDVVRFTSVAPPRLVHVGRTQLRLNAFEENVSEKDVIDALVALCHERDWTLVNFHVAPLFAGNNLTGKQRGSHEWWIELKPGTIVTPIGPQMAGELDVELQRTNPAYRARRVAGILESPTVRLVMPGVFEHWLRYHQKWGGQHKMPRCRSDRVVADEFAHMTNFARD